MAIKSGYTAEDLAKLGPDALTRKRLLAEALLNDSMKQRRIEHPLQGLSQLAETLVGGLEARKLDRAQMAGQQSGDDAWASLFGGGSSSSPSTMPMPAVSSEMSATSPGGDAQAYRDAIASIESAGSGDYSAVGPTHPKLGRALGRYQVMEANVGPWSREALGREVTPDEFLSNPQIQDAIFDNRFGGYVKQYGPEGAAQAWFGGPGGVGKTDRKDVLGTSVGEYGKRFSNAVGRELASLDPSVGMPSQSAPPLPAPVNVATPPSPPMQVADNSRLGNALVGNSGPSQEQLMGILSNPWVSDERKRIAQTLLGQQADRQNILLRQQLEQQDPAYQLGLQKSQLELENLRNPKDPESVRALRLRAQDAGLEPGTPEYQEFIRSDGKGPLVSVNTGEGDKFYENLDKKNAETFASLSDSGMQARNKMVQIDRLEGLLSQSPQGAEAGIKQWLGDMGVKTEGLDAIQSTRALLEQMVPQQRPPGSGPMSDADIVMFRNSLPRLINQPGGNQLILNTMRGIAQYEVQMGEIADAVADRSMTPAEGRKAIRELENPLAGIRDVVKGAATGEAREAETPGVPQSGTVEDGYRFKGGNPSDPNNWEKVQ